MLFVDILILARMSSLSMAILTLLRLLLSYCSSTRTVAERKLSIIGSLKSRQEKENRECLQVLTASSLCTVMMSIAGATLLIFPKEMRNNSIRYLFDSGSTR